MQLLFFGSIQEALQMKSIEKIIPATTLGDLQIFLEQEYTFLQIHPYTIAINELVVRDKDFQINNSDTVALLPPFSGG